MVDEVLFEGVVLLGLSGLLSSRICSALSAKHLSTAKYLDHYRIIYQVNEAISRLFSVLLAHRKIWTTSKLMPGQAHDTPWRKSTHGRTCPVSMGLTGFEA
jgi:hypothetical protein